MNGCYKIIKQTINYKNLSLDGSCLIGHLIKCSCYSYQLFQFINRYKGYIWQPDYDTFVANFTESVVEPLVAAAAALLILFI